MENKEEFLKWLTRNPRVVMRLTGIFNSLCPSCRAKLQSDPGSLLNDPKKMDYCEKCIKKVQPFLDSLERRTK